MHTFDSGSAVILDTGSSVLGYFIGQATIIRILRSLSPNAVKYIRVLTFIICKDTGIDATRPTANLHDC
jgi:hypothetical protein